METETFEVVCLVSNKSKIIKMWEGSGEWSCIDSRLKVDRKGRVISILTIQKA